MKNYVKFRAFMLRVYRGQIHPDAIKYQFKLVMNYQVADIRFCDATCVWITSPSLW